MKCIMKRKSMDSPEQVSSSSDDEEKTVDLTISVSSLVDELSSPPIHTPNTNGTQSMTVSQILGNTDYVNSDGEEFTHEEADTYSFDDGEEGEEADDDDDEVDTFEDAEEEIPSEHDLQVMDEMIREAIEMAQSGVPTFQQQWGTMMSQEMHQPNTVSALVFPSSGSGAQPAVEIPSDLIQAMDTMRSISQTLVGTLDTTRPRLNLGPSFLSRGGLRLPRIHHRSFHSMDTRSVVRNNLRFNRDDYEMVESYFNSLLWDEREDNDAMPSGYVRLHPNVANVLLEAFERTRRSRMISMDELIDLLLTETTVEVETLPLDDISDMYRHYLMTEGQIPFPGDYMHILEYEMLHHEYPSEEELMEMRQRAVRFYVDPERFHEEDKMLVPTLHVDRLPRRINEDKQDLVCSICQDEIKIGQETLTLVPCQHVFHATNSECLDTGSISNWLSQNNRCPLCKANITP